MNNTDTIFFTGQASATHYFVDRIQKVALDISFPRIVVKVKWAGRDPSTGNRWPSTWETLDAFEDNPSVLFDSDKWIDFTHSADYQACVNHYPEALAPIANMMSLEAPYHKEAVVEVVTEWNIAKTETFVSVAEEAECPVCYVSFQDDSIVSLLPCRHVMCPTCFAKWPKCTMGCSGP